MRHRESVTASELRVRLWLIALLAVALCGALPRRARAQDMTGTLASSGSVYTFSMVNVPSAVVQLTGNWGGRVVIEATVDGGTTWQPIIATSPTTGARVSEGTANGLLVLQNVGFTAARVRAASWSTGTATVAVTRGFVGTTAPAVQAVQLAPLSPLQQQLPSWPCNALLRAAGTCR